MSEESLPLNWPVDHNYVIKDQRIHPAFKEPKKGKRGEDVYDTAEAPTLYVPATRTELPGEIAKLERNNIASVLAFAHRYGLLGFSELSQQEKQQPYGDPLLWIWRHAETLRLCLALKSLNDHQETNKLKRLLFELSREEDRYKEYPTPAVTYARLDKQQTASFFPTSGRNPEAVVQTLAANILCTIVNHNIANLHPWLTWRGKGGSFQQHFLFTGLIEVAYWHVANALQGGEIKRCQLSGCGGLFIQTDQRQRFCPTGDKRESPCAVRDRVRRKRVRDKEQGMKHEKGRARHGKKG